MRRRLRFKSERHEGDPQQMAPADSSELVGAAFVFPGGTLSEADATMR
jgi:hypothetical protein